MKDILAKIRQALIENVDEKYKANGQTFFKEEVKFYGVSVAFINKISKEIFKEIKGKPKADIFALCEELWKSGYNEEAWMACNFSYGICKQYEPADFKVFDKWLHRYVSNWASCDTLCNHTVGEFVEMYPEYISELKKWAKSDNRWVKRGAAITLIIPARKGLFKDDIFEIADILLLDKDDLVQKGYGWMLKATSEAYQKDVFDYVMSKKAVMPRTSLRYAIEKMPKDLKAEAMKK